MKTIISATLIIIVVICVFLVYVAIPSPVQKYTNATSGEIYKSAQSLSELAEKGELTKQDVDKIFLYLAAAPSEYGR